MKIKLFIIIGCIIGIFACQNKFKTIILYPKNNYSGSVKILSYRNFVLYGNDLKCLEDNIFYDTEIRFYKDSTYQDPVILSFRSSGDYYYYYDPMVNKYSDRIFKKSESLLDNDSYFLYEQEYKKELVRNLFSFNKSMYTKVRINKKIYRDKIQGSKIFVKLQIISNSNNLSKKSDTVYFFGNGLLD